MKRSFTKFLGMVLFLVFGMGKVNAQSNVMSGSSENVLGVKVPKIESFVLVTNEDGADIYKSASADSPWRVIWLEDDEEEGEVQVDVTWSDKKAPSKYTVERDVEYEGGCLLLLGEEGDFWKVNIYRDYAPNLVEGYIKKADAKVAAFEPLTADMIKAPNDDKLSPTVVKTDGLEYLEEAYAKGKGALMCTGHFGNWELLGANVALHGYPMLSIARKQNNSAMDLFINEYREGKDVSAYERAVVVPKKRIIEQNYDLTAARYVDKEAVNCKYEMVKLGDVAEVIRGISFTK